MKENTDYKLDFNVSTEIQGDDIHTKIDMVMNGVIADTQRQIIKTKDAQVREALVKLGWTPPTSIVLPFSK